MKNGLIGLALLSLAACESANTPTLAGINSPDPVRSTVAGGSGRNLPDQVVTSGGGVPISASATFPAPSTAAANQFAVNFLNSIQARSIAERREYCGFFVVDAAGNIAATPPLPGTTASCASPAPGGNAFASYHTHGAYDRGYDNEVPSDADLLGDFQFGVDGYVSTPGGRIWHIELDDRTARQVCGRGCVYSDPGFVPEDEAGIRSSYTVDQIRARYR